MPIVFMFGKHQKDGMFNDNYIANNCGIADHMGHDRLLCWSGHQSSGKPPEGILDRHRIGSFFVDRDDRVLDIL